MQKTFFIIFLFINQIAISQDFKAYEQVIPNTTVKFKMMPIPAGEFVLGSPENEVGHEALWPLPRCVGAELLAQGWLVHFAGGVAWQRIGKPNRMRQLVASQVGGAVGNQRGF